MKLNIVPARTGIQWVKLGIRTFFRQPLGLTGLVFMYLSVLLLIATLPLVGLIVPFLLLPAATLGLFVATERVAAGTFPMPSVFLSGFRAGPQCKQSLLVLGLIHVAVWAALWGLLLLVFPGPLVDAAAAVQPGAVQPAAAAAKARLSPAITVASFVALPIGFVFAYAPALVYWHAVTPVKSLFFSIVALWRNLRAFVTFLAAWFLLLSVAALVMLLLSFGNTTVLLEVLAPVAFVCFQAMLFSSLYFSFRDSFVAGPEEPTPT